MESIVIRNLNDINNNIDDKMLKESVIVYCRVSTKQQIEGNSLNIQQRNGEEFYQSSLFNFSFKHILVFREEGKSGDDFKIGDDSFIERELLSYIVTQTEKGLIKYFWIENSDRLSRNTNTSSLIKKVFYENDVNFYILNQKLDLDNMENDLMFQMFSLIDQYENHKRFRKGLFGKLESVRNGKWFGGKRNYGFMKGEENGSMLINKQQSKIVNLIFKMFGDEHKSIKDIVDYLDMNNIIPPKSKSWNTESVRNMLRNRIYIGQHRLEMKLLKNKTKDECRKLGKTEIIHQNNLPKIISEKLFNKVQNRLTENGYELKVKNTIKYDYLLWNMLYCGSCGNSLKIQRNLKVGINRYYCDYKSKVFKYGDNVEHLKECGKKNIRSVNIEVMDKLIWNEFVKVFGESHIIKEEYKKQLLGKVISERTKPKVSIKNHNKTIKYLETKLTELNNRNNELYKHYMINEIDKPTYNSLKKDIEEKINQTNTKIDNTKNDIITLSNGFVWYDWVNDFNKIYSEIKSIESVDEKRKYLKKYIDKVEVSYCFITKLHTVKLLFKVKIVKDKRLRLGKYQFKVTKGQSEKVISNINSKELSKMCNNYLSLPTITESHSTVVDLDSNIVSKVNSVNQSKFNTLKLQFNLTLINGSLINKHQYNQYQQQLYDLIKNYLEVEKLSYNRIRDILFEKGYRSVRGNKVLKPNYIWSIYKKGKIRENRIKVYKKSYSHIKLEIN